MIMVVLPVLSFSVLRDEVAVIVFQSDLGLGCLVDGVAGESECIGFNVGPR